MTSDLKTKQNPTESKSVVIAALIANAAIAVLKFIGYLLTFSPAHH